MALSKPTSISSLAKQAEEIDRMFDELYRVVSDLSTAGTSTTGPIGPIGPPGAMGLPGMDGEDADWRIPGPAGVAGAGSTSEVTITTTGNIDDLDFSNASLIRMNNASLATIRGLKAGSAGQHVTIVSVNAQVDLSHQDTNDATAASRLINFATSAASSLAAGAGAATYVYDNTTSRWRLKSHYQGAWITPAYAGADYTAATGTWTVDAGDVTTCKYYLTGQLLVVTLYIATSSVSDTPATLRRVIPGGFTSNSELTDTYTYNDNGGGYTVGLTEFQPSVTIIRFYKAGATGNFAASTNNTAVLATVFCDVQ